MKYLLDTRIAPHRNETSSGDAEEMEQYEEDMESVHSQKAEESPGMEPDLERPHSPKMPEPLDDETEVPAVPSAFPLADVPARHYNEHLQLLFTDIADVHLQLMKVGSEAASEFQLALWRLVAERRQRLALETRGRRG